MRMRLLKLSLFFFILITTFSCEKDEADATNEIIQNTGDNQALIGETIFGESANEHFGFKVSLSGNGLRFVSTTNGHHSEYSVPYEKIKVFEYSSNSWNQIVNDIDPVGGGTYPYGTEICISYDGSIVAVKSDLKVSIYQLISNSWTLLGQEIVLTSGNYNSSYEQQIALSNNENIIAIADTSYDNFRGQVKIYSLLNNIWVQLGNDIIGPQPDSGFGRYLSIADDGQTIAVSAPLYYGAGGGYNNEQEGYLQVYSYSNNLWTELGQAFIGDEVSNQKLGWSHDLSGDGETLVITSLQSDVSVGIVRVYKLNINNWTQIGNTISGIDYTQFGLGLSLNYDGNYLAVASRRGLNLANDEILGHVKIYNITTNSLSEIGIVYGDSHASYFGHGVSLSSNGERFAVGAPASDTSDHENIGAVRVYDLSNVLSSN